MNKILVIEDELSVPNNIVHFLREENFQALDAENGLIGLQLAQQNNLDLIVCDILMPELDGYGVFNKLQADPETALIPFIFLTVKGEKEDRRRWDRIGGR